MFSGWRLINDLEKLIELKKGKLEFDFLDKYVKLNDEFSTKDFNMFYEILNWFDKDLKSYNIEKNNILQASLIVDFLVELKEGKPKSRTKGIFIINLKMKSTIKTDEKEYLIEKENTQQYHCVDNKKFGFD